MKNHLIHPLVCLVKQVNDMEQVKGLLGMRIFSQQYHFGEHVILKSSTLLNLILHFGLPFQQLDESGNVFSSSLRSSREKRDKNTGVNQPPSNRHLSFHPLTLPWWSCFDSERTISTCWCLTRNKGTINPLFSHPHTPIQYSLGHWLCRFSTIPFSYRHVPTTTTQWLTVKDFSTYSPYSSSSSTFSKDSNLQK